MVLLAAVGVLLFAGKTLDAGVVGSPHDFTARTAVAPSGSCSACHISHGADAAGPLWPRTLADYVSYLTVNGDSSGKPNYILPPTLACYDCHDDQSSFQSNKPPLWSFTSSHTPPDIAFGSDGPGGSISGYYENSPPSSDTYGADPNLRPMSDNAALNKTGGHYFKHKDPTGTSGDKFDIGDKLPCRDCHDPHQWSETWWVFIRTDLPNAGDVIPSLSSVYGSDNMTNQSTGTHSNAASRKLCVACHTYSNTPTIPVKYSQINATEYSNSSDNVPKPPDTLDEHKNWDNVSTVACVSCHSHNNIDGNCARCHGYPPSPYPPTRVTVPPASFPGGDSHPKHYGKNDAGATASVYGFNCKVCHAKAPRGSRQDVATHPNNATNIAFDLSAYTAFPPQPDGTTSAGTAYTCTAVYCHSLGHMDNNATSYYKTVTWGTASLGCNKCHGDVAQPQGTRQYGMPNYTSGAPGSATANSHQKHVVDRGYGCYVCHFITVGADNAIKGASHVNGSREIVFDGTIARPLGGTPYNTSTKTCSVSCHGSSGNARWGGTLSCDGCHQSQGAGKGSLTYSGVHQSHSAGSGYGFACEVCHAEKAATHPNRVHINNDNSAGPRYVEVYFTDNASSQAYDNTGSLRSFDMYADRYVTSWSPQYTENATVAGIPPDTVNDNITWSTGSCSNVWCHSNANPIAGGGAGGTNLPSTPRWDAAIGSCTVCHRGPDTFANMGSPTGLSAAHRPHVATNGYAFTCDECHANTVQNDSTTAILGYAYHVNGSKYDIKGSVSVRSSTVRNDGFAYDDIAKTCSNNYCHSQGNKTTAPFDPPNVPAVAWNGSLGTNCTGCHGGDANSGNMISTGKHAEHVPAYSCSVCHSKTVSATDNRALNPVTGSLFHVNGAADFEPIPGVATKGSCANVTCHGGITMTIPSDNVPAGTDRWSSAPTPIPCFDCHWNLMNNTENPSRPTAPVDNVPNAVDSGQYAGSGHGLPRASVYPGTGANPGAGFVNVPNDNTSDCYYCHSRNAAHGSKSPSDPYRLGSGSDTAGQKDPVAQGAFADDTDALCLRCHGAVTPGWPRATRSNTINMAAHSKAVTLSSKDWPPTGATDYAWKCVDCHDPHGDANWKMIRSVISAPTSAGDTAFGSDTHGTPLDNGNLTSVTFTDNTGYGANSYAISGGSGICEVCHNSTTVFRRGTATNENVGTTHENRITGCSTCHPHKSGFAPTACKGCHGPDSVATAQAAPNVGTYWTSSGHGMTSPKTINVDCEACHNVGFVTGADHKTDGSAGAGPPPANINTQTWPGKTENANNQRNQNTVHLSSAYFPAGFPGSNPANKYNFALAFDQKCGNQATGCHTANAHNNHPVVPGAPQPADRVLRFPDGGTVSNPKAYNWYPAISDYTTQFYQSRSPWDIEDITTNASLSYPDSGTRYGLCVSCHDPHGTNAPINLLGSTTNRMLRGDSLNAGQFCNTACHTTRTPP